VSLVVHKRDETRELLNILSQVSVPGPSVPSCMYMFLAMNIIIMFCAKNVGVGDLLKRLKTVTVCMD